MPLESRIVPKYFEHSCFHAGARAFQGTLGQCVHKLDAIRITQSTNTNFRLVCYARHSVYHIDSGYYDWAKRTPSQRAIANCQLIEQIMTIYRTSDFTYGGPRITVELADLGVRVNHKRVCRLMREAGIKGVLSSGNSDSTMFELILVDLIEESRINCGNAGCRNIGQIWFELLATRACSGLLPAVSK